MNSNMIRASFVALATATFFLVVSPAKAQEVFALGPVEKIVIGPSASVSVLGQKYGINSAAKIYLANKVASASVLSFLAPGTYVSLEGFRALDGQITARKLSILKARYVAGSSPILVAGVVDSVDLLIGTVRVGSLDIDVTAVRPLNVGALSVGAIVQVAGVQSAPFAFVSATEVQSQSIEGTGVQSIEGTGKQSIEGTGKQSIEGTGKQSIEGTGKQSIEGTGKQSIEGTGKQSIKGTGK